MHQRGWIKVDHAQMPFGATEINFLGRIITPEGVKPQKKSITIFLEKKQNPEIQKGLATIPRIPQLLQKLHTETWIDVASYPCGNHCRIDS